MPIIPDFLYVLKSKIPFVYNILAFLIGYINSLYSTDFMKHYGCPASNRTKKLHLKKQLFNKI